MTECYDVVDEKDNVIGKATREECHKNGLIHRAIHVIILNKDNQILLQKRSMKKDMYKGNWSTSTSGHVDSGESYEEAAHRELKEELGIDTDFKELFTFLAKIEKESEFCKVFIARYDGSFEYNREEIDETKFLSKEEIDNLISKDMKRVDEEFIIIFNELIKRGII